MTHTNPADSRHWRVAIAGLGHWYSAYGLARALQEYPRATLVGAAWSNTAQLEEFAATFRVEGWSSYDAVFERDDIDIVQISAPVDEIPDLTIRAARAGKHLILGKPPAMTLAEMDRMVDAVESSGITCVPFQASMRLRFASLKARLDRGDIGALVVLHQTARWSIAEDWFRSGRPGWFVDPAHVPGGAFIDEGIYWLDAVRWLADSEVVEIDARMDNLVHKDLAVEDWGLAMLKMANGVHATLEAAWTINAPRVSGPSPKQNSVIRLEAIGTRGEITDQWFRMPGRAVLAAAAEDWVFERQSEEPFAPPSPTMLDHLIACVEGHTPPAATIHDARTSFAVAMAAYESAREGRPVRLAARSS